MNFNFNSIQPVTLSKHIYVCFFFYFIIPTHMISDKPSSERSILCKMYKSKSRYDEKSWYKTIEITFVPASCSIMSNGLLSSNIFL